MISCCFKVVKWMKKLLFMSKYVAQSETWTLLLDENNIALRMILVSFFHITDTERNITHKDQETC